MRILILAGLLAASLPVEAQTNKELARRYYEEVWNQRKLETVNEIFAPSYQAHDPRIQSTEPETPQFLKDSIAAWHKSSAATARIDDQVAEGDKVVTRWTWQLRAQSGLQRTLAGRDLVEMGAIEIFRFDKGKVVEVWRLRDDLGGEEKLGVTKLYYLQGFIFGAMSALIISRLLRGRPVTAPAGK